MSPRNKVVIAVALAAVLVAVGAGAVRCAANTAAGGGQAQQQQQQVGQEPSEPEAGNASQEADGGTLDVLTGHSWKAADGSGATLEFRDGAFVENGATLEATAFTVTSDASTATQRVLTIDPVRSGLASGDVAVIVTGEEGSYQAASDAFALCGTYVQAASPTAAFALTGVSKAYLYLAGCSEDDIARAVSELCARKAPSATQASFDGEVYLDLNTGTSSATFHANDAARTIVTVTVKNGQATAAS